MRGGRKREYQLLIGAGRRSRTTPTTGDPTEIPRGRPVRVKPMRRSTTRAAPRQVLVIVAVTFFLFFCGRVVWSFGTPALDRVRAPERRAPPRAVLAAMPTPSTKHWKNSLGMEFVRAGDALVASRETRVRDFAAFVRATGYLAGASWDDPRSAEHPNRPVVAVSWEDAMAFCRWLTETERHQKLLAGNHAYRLPTDAEWSRARSNLQSGEPGTVARRVVWEWCLDSYEGDPNYRVYRIGVGVPPQFQDLLASYRGLGCAARRAEDRGFRCVLESQAGEVACLSLGR